MKPRLAHPNWWSLYLIVILMAAAFTLEANAHLSENGHRMLEMAILLPGFGLIYLWLKLNERALVSEEQEKQRQLLHRSLLQLQERPTRWTAHTETRQNPLQQATNPWQARLAGLVSIFTGFFHF